MGAYDVCNQAGKPHGLGAATVAAFAGGGQPRAGRSPVDRAGRKAQRPKCRHQGDSRQARSVVAASFAIACAEASSPIVAPAKNARQPSVALIGRLSNGAGDPGRTVAGRRGEMTRAVGDLDAVIGSAPRRS